MKIRSLKIHNYKCFDNLEVDFDPDYNLHVFIAPNMVGKSALLKAARIAISAYLRKINKENIGIDKTDFRVIGTNPFTDTVRECEIEVEADVTFFWEKKWHSSFAKWKISRNNSSKERTKYAYVSGWDLDKIAPSTYDRVIENAEMSNPLLLYVGTEYIHLAHAKTDTLKFDGSALQGYWYSLEETSMKNYVFDWLIHMFLVKETQEFKSNAALMYGDFPDIVIKTFESAVKEIFDGEIVSVQSVKNFTKDKRFKPSPPLYGHFLKPEYYLTFCFKNNEVCTYEMLSDGYKYLVLLAGEIVTRCLLLNKHLKYDAANETNGVVIIDEFGIHLHPELQNAALTRLAKAFPKIQFLVYTHSPLLLNGLKKEQVHILTKDISGNRVIENAKSDIVGLGAEGILIKIFNLPTTYDTESLKWAEDYKKLFLKKLQNPLSDTEEAQFEDLLKKLSGIRLDTSLNLDNGEGDSLYQRFKERLTVYLKEKKDESAALTDDEIDKLIGEALNC